MKSTDEVKHQLQILLSEDRSTPWPARVQRDFPADLLDASRLLTVVGPRRAGKTYLCYQLMETLHRRGLPRRQMLYLNFEDERLYPLSGQELTHLFDVVDEAGEWDPAKPFCAVLDEVQNVPQWSRWARRVMERYPHLRLILTGSSSKLLSAELATELRGRGLSFQIFPYSLRERARAEGLEGTPDRQWVFGRLKNRMRRLFGHYLETGGFPAACLLTNPTPILQNYYQTMFMRDLVERYRIKNVPLFEEFLKISISRFASLFSVSSLHGSLRERHGRISKATLVQYARYAREVFLLFETPRFDTKVRQQLTLPRKIYGVDPGLLNAIRFSTSEDRGRLLENAVFMELHRRGHELFYWRGQSECDFLIKEDLRVKAAIQAAWSVESKPTLEREMRGLLEAMDRFGLREGMILTAGEYRDLREGKRKIRVRPFWFWAMGGES